MPSDTGRAARSYTVTPLRTLVRRRIAWSFGRRQGPLSRTDCPLPGHPSLGPSHPSVHEEF
ncbi:hypothetical protein ACFXGT_20035 [Streptomyces sp. NPDC059352]|uniref:hypothetical protein n=1 Tax=Streptomyces sp. NPDC059352 TaxID=3346810 RepID=UPI0036CA4AC6